MARVWAARLLGQGGFSKIVALKMILPDLASDPEFEQMFLDEARIAAKLRHPNVCETFDLGEDNRTLFIAMEWVEGVSLLRLVRTDGRAASPQPPERLVRRPIAPRLGARIVADACAGLHAAHELVDDDGTPLNVVHRDVSPHNVLISANGTVKVTDFGVAMALGKSHATATGQIKGKISYMSPEQLTGAPLDGRSDVFALGCVLYEVTTGRRPFPGTTDAQVVREILQGDVPLPSTIDRAYPSELETIAMCALAAAPSARFASAEAMRFALDAYLAKGQPVGASAIAELVKDRCGAEIERRRAQIRTECANRGASLSSPPAARRGSSPDVEASAAPTADEISDTTPEHDWKGGGAKAKPNATASANADSSGSSLPSAVVAIRPHRQTRATMSHAVLGGLLAAALVGGLGWYAVARTGVAAVGAAPHAGDRPSGTALSAPPSSPPSLAPPSLAPPSQATDAAARRVRFRLSPPNAVLVVNGVPMPAGVDTLERPADGHLLQVIVRADRHDDHSVQIDPSTPALVDVALVPRGRVRARTPGARGAASAGSAPPGGAMPNPYE